MSKSKVEFNTEGLKVMQTALKKAADSNYHLQIGIFGNKTSRKSGEMTNAEVGFVHEMGSVTRNIPKRSFLWDTFRFHGKELTESLKEATLVLYKMGKVEEYLAVACKAAENMVQKAFDTQGFGQWAPLSYKTLLRKAKGNLFVRMQKAAQDLYEGGHNVAILIKTGQLRRAIASRVRKA